MHSSTSSTQKYPVCPHSSLSSLPIPVYQTKSSTPKLCFSPSTYCMYSRPASLPFQSTPYYLSLLISLHTHTTPPCLPNFLPHFLPPKHFLPSVFIPQLSLQEHFPHPLYLWPSTSHILHSTCPPQCLPDPKVSSLAAPPPTSILPPPTSILPTRTLSISLTSAAR